MTSIVKFFYFKLLILFGASHLSFVIYSADAETKLKPLEKMETKIVATVDGKPIFLSEIIGMAQRLPEQYRKMSLEAVYPSLFCLLYTSPSPRDRTRSRMPSSA